MELFLLLSRALLRLIVSILTVSVLGKLALRSTGYDVSERTFYICSGVAGFLCHTLYFSVIYPHFLDPLRSLPLIRSSDTQELNPVKYGPRGEKALQWVKDHPGVDMLRVRTFPGMEVLLPVSDRAFRDILVTNAYDFNKPRTGKGFFSRVLGEGIILVDGHRHKHQRKHLNPAFRIQNIQALYPLIIDKTAIFLDRLLDDSKSKGQTDISAWVSRLTMDIIGPATLSTDFQSLYVEDHPIEKAYHLLLEQGIGQAVLFTLSAFWPQFVVRRLPIPTNRMINSQVAIIRKAFAEILHNKTSSGDIKESDILSNVITSGEFSHEELIDQMVTFIGAGHETTAATISWVTHFLTLPKYAHYQSILRKEVRNALPSAATSLTFNPTTTRSTLESLPYLNGICEEALRLYPPVTTTARIAVNDTTVAGYRVPKHKMTVLSPWAINRNPEFWGANADEMVPERWIDRLPDGTMRFNKHGGAKSNFHQETFLHGTRACIGRDLAKAEIRCVVAALFARFEVGRLPGDDGSVKARGMLTIKPLGGLKVVVKEAS